MINMKVHGMKELLEQLLTMQKSLAIKTMAKAARQAFKPVLAAARSKVPVDTGLLRKRIRLQVVKPRSGDAVVVVGLRLGSTPKTLKGKAKAEARNWAWYERGIPSRSIPAHPFLRPALDQNASAVLELLKDELAKEIAAALKR